MFIKKIEIKNFRSFQTLSMEPANLNVLIGPNASGKSNFLQIFRFLRDITSGGLQNAIAMQGGIEYLQNANPNKNNSDTYFHIHTDTLAPKPAMKVIKGQNVTILPKSCHLEFTIRHHKATNNFFVPADRLAQSFDLIIGNQPAVEAKIEFHKTAAGPSQPASCQRKLAAGSDMLQAVGLAEDDLFPAPFQSASGDRAFEANQQLLIENPFLLPFPGSLSATLRNVPLYDLDLLKDNTDSSVIGRTRLEDNGDNIAIVLKQLLANSDKKREFLNYVRHILPFIEDIEIEQILDKHLQIKYRETYTNQSYMPANLMSSGTITMLAIIVGIFFQNNQIIVFEEPGGRIHPYLISRIINMMQNMEQSAQIFLTTHNPEIVKYAGANNVFCLARDKHGFSTINHLSAHKDIVQFLENEIGLDELFVQNLL